MVLAGNSCIAVPVEIYLQEGKAPVITTYSCFGKIAEEFEAIFGHDVIASDALNWLDEKLYSAVKALGYEHCYDDIHMLSEYSISALSQLRNRDEAVLVIKDESELDGLDTALIDGIAVDKEAAVVVKDGKLVSIACANDVPFEDDSVELFVETDAAYRNLGYGAATVSTLAELYLKKGITVRYKCAKNNDASIRLAEKCGFEKNGNRYSYVCYAVEEEIS